MSHPDAAVNFLKGYTGVVISLVSVFASSVEVVMIYKSHDLADLIDTIYRCRFLGLNSDSMYRIFKLITQKKSIACLADFKPYTNKWND